MLTDALFCVALLNVVPGTDGTPRKLNETPSTLMNPAHPRIYIKHHIPKEHSLRSGINRSTSKHKPILTDPVQNVGQASFKAVPEPCASHADRYGDRTASGTEAGLNGVAVQVTAPNVEPKNTVASRTNTEKIFAVILNYRSWRLETYEGGDYGYWSYSSSFL